MNNFVPPKDSAFGPMNLSPQFHSAPTAIGFAGLDKSSGNVQKAGVITYTQKAA
jgi:hypothetical protein